MDKLRRTLLLAPAALALAATPAFAEKFALRDISAYLNSIRTAEAPFTQINPDGSRSKGKLFIHRPNRMRFDYDPPNAALVLASAGQVAVFDNKSNAGPEIYPLSKTPLNLILAQNVNLNRARMVVAHEDMGNATAVVAQDPAHPEYGRIRLVFAGRPMELRQWTVTDDTGNQTTVVLGPMRLGQRYAASLFSIESERARRR